MTVQDALFFCDGFGIAPADQIRVGAERVKVVLVDHAKNLVRVDRAITWAAGAKVTLDYAGTAPDVGSIETGQQR